MVMSVLYTETCNPQNLLFCLNETAKLLVYQEVRWVFLCFGSCLGQIWVKKFLPLFRGEKCGTIMH